MGIVRLVDSAEQGPTRDDVVVGFVAAAVGGDCLVYQDCLAAPETDLAAALRCDFCLLTQMSRNVVIDLVEACVFFFLLGRLEC